MRWGATLKKGAPGRTTQKLMDLVLEEYDSTEMIEQIRQVLMTELGLSSEEISNRYLLNTLNSYLREIRWTPTETIMTGIGQSITEVTPVGVARYIAAVANGGDVLEVQLVDKVLSPDSSVVMEKQPNITSHLDGVDASLSVIRQGHEGRYLRRGRRYRQRILPQLRLHRSGRR